MPIATPEVYAQMLDRAKAEGFAYPAINITSSETVNAAIKGFADAGSDGIVQVSTGGAEYLSGPSIKNMVAGSVAFAAYAAEVAKSYPVNIALHTDHCPKDKLDTYVRPLLAISEQRVRDDPLAQGHGDHGHPVGLHERLAQQGVRLGAGLLGLEVVALLEQHRVDLVGRHELDHVDLVARGHRQGVQVLVGEGDQLAVVGLVALDDVGVLDLLPVQRARPLVLDPATVGRMHLVEPDVVVGRRRVRLHRDAHQTERHRAAPHRAHIRLDLPDP